MRELRKVKAGSNDPEYKVYHRAINDAIKRIIEPHRNCGRSHLARNIGAFATEHQIDMAKICAGIKSRPEDVAHAVFAVKTAVMQITTIALLRMVEHENTQWNDPELFFIQLQNQIENVQRSQMNAIIVEVSG